ncbi:Uncharacterised protein [Bordetella pertussis]|nr:Uncharacterised protein [Bordetella pertussis]
MAASSRTTLPTSSRMGRLDATTMIAKTNSGSVKLRVSMYWTARSVPAISAIQAISTNAHTPKTASTSESRCHTPACGPLR